MSDQLMYKELDASKQEIHSMKSFGEKMQETTKHVSTSSSSGTGFFNM